MCRLPQAILIVCAVAWWGGRTLRAADPVPAAKKADQEAAAGPWQARAELQFPQSFNAGTAPAFSPDGKKVGIGGYDMNTTTLQVEGVVLIFDLDKAKLESRWSLGRQRVVSGPLQFSSDGKLLGVLTSLEAKSADHASHGYSLELWEVGKQRLKNKVAFQGGSSSGYYLETSRQLQSWSFSSDSKLVAIADWNQGVKVLETETLREQKRLAVRNPSGLAFTPDGKTIAAPEGAKEIRFWELPSGKSTGALGPLGGKNPRGLTWITFTPDGNSVLTYFVPGYINFGFPGNPGGQTGQADARNATVKTWDLTARKEQMFLPDALTKSLTNPNGPDHLLQVLFAHDGHTLLEMQTLPLVVNPMDRFQPLTGLAVRAWDLRTKKVQQTVFETDKGSTGMAVAGDGRLLAVVKRGGFIGGFGGQAVVNQGMIKVFDLKQSSPGESENKPGASSSGSPKQP